MLTFFRIPVVVRKIYLKDSQKALEMKTNSSGWTTEKSRKKHTHEGNTEYMKNR